MKIDHRCLFTHAKLAITFTDRFGCKKDYIFIPTIVIFFLDEMRMYIGNFSSR